MPTNLCIDQRHSLLVPSVADAAEPAPSIPRCNKNPARRRASEGLAGALLVTTSIRLILIPTKEANQLSRCYQVVYLVFLHTWLMIVQHLDHSKTWSHLSGWISRQVMFTVLFFAYLSSVVAISYLVSRVMAWAELHPIQLFTEYSQRH